MINNIVILILLSLSIVTCKRDEKFEFINIPEDPGCIEWKKVTVQDHSGFPINSTNISIINSLFSNNGIDYANYRYIRYTHDSSQTYFPPYAKYDEKVVRVKEFTNGLEILNNDQGFIFKNNILNYRTGNPTQGTTLSSFPTRTVKQIRTLFLRDMQELDQNFKYLKDSCMSAQFGYYNLNAGEGSSSENLVKCWKVTVSNRHFPTAYYYDFDGQRISYDNGIRTTN